MALTTITNSLATLENQIKTKDHDYTQLLLRARLKNKEFEDVLNSVLAHNRKLIASNKQQIHKIKQKQKDKYDHKIKEIVKALKNEDNVFDSKTIQQDLTFTPSRIMPPSNELENQDEFNFEVFSNHTDNIQRLVYDLENSEKKRNLKKSDKPSQAKKIA